MKRVAVAELTGAALDYVVAKCEKRKDLAAMILARPKSYGFAPSIVWAQGGPIIEREEIELSCWAQDGWTARATDYSKRPGNDEVFAEAFHASPLVAAMRCYVASQCGDYVNVPEEVTE